MHSSTHHLPDSTTPIVLTIAGSDSGGGAGIQADIKAISATGGYACSVVTALTAQNTQGVNGIFPVDVSFIELQLDAVFSDLNVVAVKVGMLSDVAIIRAVAQKIKHYQPRHVVLDPVMVTRNGDRLLAPEAIATLQAELFPLADIITPNLQEAAALISVNLPNSETQMLAMCDSLRSLTDRTILLKGGFLSQTANSTDFLVEATCCTPFSVPRINTGNTHGTGCTLSAAIASYLAQGYPLTLAVASAKDYITQAIQHADRLNVGNGHGPVDHFFASKASPSC